MLAANSGWHKIFPMRSKCKSCEALSNLFTQEMMSPACTCDNAIEMIHGLFNQMLKDTSFQLKPLQPYIPSQILKRGMIRNSRSAHITSWWSKCFLRDFGIIVFSLSYTLNHYATWCLWIKWWITRNAISG